MRKIINMKKSIILGAIMMATLVGTAQATLITYSSGTLNEAIPDGNLVGITESTTISGVPSPSADYTSTIQNVDVNLDISGGYNGDLYAYLVLQNGSTTTAMLLNRIGTSGSDSWGNDGSGMDVTLSSSGALGNIHNAPFANLTGTYQPDGVTTLAAFNGLDMNGIWTLYLVNMVSGDPSILVSWGLDITPTPTTPPIFSVPEPTTIIAGALLLLPFGASTMRILRKKRTL